MSQWIKLLCAALVGAGAATLVGQRGATAMAEDRPNAAPAQPAAVSIDERDLKWVYVNAYRIHTTAEEMLLDVGVNMPDPNGNARAGAPPTLFRVTDRLVLSYASARRLNNSLSQVLQRFDEFKEKEQQPPVIRQK